MRCSGEGAGRGQVASNAILGGAKGQFGEGARDSKEDDGEHQDLAQQSECAPRSSRASTGSKAGIGTEAGVQTEQLSWISLAPLTADEQVPESDDPFSAGWITSECARRALERKLKANFLLSRKLELAESLLLKDQQAKYTGLLAKDAPLQRRLLSDC